MTDKKIDKMDKEIQQIKKTQAMLNKKLEDTELATEQARAEGKKLGIKEVVGWLREYAVYSGRIPLNLVLEDMRAHSPFISIFEKEKHE